jgi:predicted transcriptional regulator
MRSLQNQCVYPEVDRWRKKEMKKLPEAEFEVMKAVWAIGGEVATPAVTAALSDSRNWTQQTVLTLLRRLEKRGFLTSVKAGKERYFTPLKTQEEYVRFESELFFVTFHKKSVASMVQALYGGEELEQDDIDELQRFLDEKGR